MANEGYDTGLRIRGFELWWDIGGYSGPFGYLRSPAPVPVPVAYSPTGLDHARREVRSWRDAGGVAHARVGAGALPFAPMDAIRGDLTPEEAEAIRSTMDRVIAERFPEPEPESRGEGAEPVEVPAMAEIAAACEAEGTPLAPVSLLSRPSRTCLECGSPVYGEYCTHCPEC